MQLTVTFSFFFFQLYLSYISGFYNCVVRVFNQCWHLGEIRDLSLGSAIMSASGEEVWNA